jgi:hypothetical protein
MPTGRGHRVAPIAAAIVAVAMFIAPTGSAEPIPSVRLFAASTRLRVQSGRNDVVSVDPGIYITPTGDDFELHVSRSNYDTPFTFEQVDPDTGAILRSLPLDSRDGWFGLKGFVHYEVVDAHGAVVKREALSFCPNADPWQRERISDEGPLSPRYPRDCLLADLARRFIKGMVWGIDLGWASPVIDRGGYYGGRISWKAERRSYTIRVYIDPSWVRLLSIEPADASREVQVTIARSKTAAHHAALASSDAASAVAPSVPSDAASAPDPRVPILTNPNPASLPDITPAPAYFMSTRQRNGHDYLTFASTELNQGPGTLVVDGFRGTNDRSMDAFQYFLIDGEPIGRAPVGEFEFHAGRHNHWHFQQFALYSLLDAESKHVIVSDKQSWCLVNTDALDLTVPHANLTTRGLELRTSCGGPKALWIREVLDVGWADTYGQGVGSGAFDITDLRNGTYYVRVQVNPLGSLFEADTSNNVQDRLIRLRGKPGHRRVIVPPWHGIDTENTCDSC